MRILNLIFEKKYIVSFLVAFIIYHLAYGIHTLDPTNINWLMSAYHDWGTHYLGWAFYRNDPWDFPLGNTQSYFYPIGTNVGFTDTIPLLAFVFKLFAAILPEDFQFFGLWIFLCFFLTAFFTIKIFKLFKVHPVITLVAVLIITTNPVLIFRGMHPSLCAHWLILASVYNYLLVCTKDNVYSINRNQFFLFFLSATINPYLAVMVAGFNIIIPFKHYWFDKTLNLKKMILYPLISFTAGIVFWFVFGLLVFSDSTNLDVGDIYGLYAFNLNSFFNSYGHYSKFLPHLGMVTDMQHEGFGYLGLGMIVIFLLAMLYLLYLLIAKRSVLRRAFYMMPLFLLCLLLLVFAVSDEVSFGKDVVFTYRTLGVIEKMGNIFRAIGRFSWVMYYCIIVFSFLLISRIRVSNYIKIPILVGLMGLQFYDTENIITIRDLQSGRFDTKLDDSKWIGIFKHFDEIITYPPFTNNLVYPMDYQDLSFLALKSGKPITNGYVARENLTQSGAYKDTLAAVLGRGEIKKDQLFVTTPNRIEEFKVLIYKNKVNIRKLNNFIFIYPKHHKLDGILKSSPEDKRYIDSIYSSYQQQQKPIASQIRWKSTDQIQFYLEQYSYIDDVIQISGWAFNKETTNNSQDTIFVAMTNNNKTYLFSTERIPRADITVAYKKENLEGSGFKATIFMDNLPKENFEVGIAIKNKANEYYYIKANQLLETGKKIYKTPRSIAKMPSEKPILVNLEAIEQENDYIKLSGWAVPEGRTSVNTEIHIVFIKDNKNYLFDTDLILRNDVTKYLKNGHNCDLSGFSLRFKTRSVPEGKYKIGVLITDSKNNNSYFKILDKKFYIKK